MGDFDKYIVRCEDGVPRMCGLEKRTTPIGGITYMRDGVPCAVPQWKSDELPDCPVIPRPEWRTTENMKPFEWSNRYQNGDPACCLAALCGAGEFYFSKNGMARTKLDWRKAWLALTGGRGGAAVDAALKYAMENGLPLADGSGVIKIEEAWDCPTIDAFVSGILRGCTGVACHDVHAECVVGVDVSGSHPCVVMVNSHYQDLGGKNWHNFPADSIELSSYGAILIRAMTLRPIDTNGFPDAKE